MEDDNLYAKRTHTTGSGSVSSAARSPQPLTLDDEIGIGLDRRKSSSANTIRSTVSVKSLREKDIYGDMSQEEIRLHRQATREAVKREYTTEAQEDEELAPNNDGQSVRDIDPELVTWDGPDDPQNPRNWPKHRKAFTTLIVAIYTFLSPMTSSIISPAIGDISAEFGITNSAIQAMVMSIMVLAWAVTPLVVAPISEVVGRLPVLNVSVVLLLIFNVACGCAKSTGQIMAFRFLAGVAGAPPLSVGAGTLADLYSDQDRNFALAAYSIGPTMGPVFAPIICGFIVENVGWRWVFWVLCMVNGAVAVFGIIFYRETYTPVLLARKCAKLRKESGNPNLHTIFEVGREPFWTRFFVSISRPVQLLFNHPIIVLLGLFMAFAYGFNYLMIVAFPALWKTYYGYNLGIMGLTYIGMGVGFGVGILFWAWSVQRNYTRSVERNGGVSKPEFRIITLPYSGIIMGVGLIWYGWSAQARICFIMPIIGTALFAFALVGVFQCIQSYVIDMNPRLSASAIGAVSMFRSFFGFGFPLFGAAMYNRLDYGWANTLCGILAIILGVPFPLLVLKYGERIRAFADKRMDAIEEKRLAKRAQKEQINQEQSSTDFAEEKR